MIRELIGILAAVVLLALMVIAAFRVSNDATLGLLFPMIALALIASWGLS